MKTTQLIATAALSLLAAAGAQAQQNYDYQGAGVLPLTHEASRAQVEAGAVEAARLGNPYDNGQSVLPARASSVDRAAVYAGAVAAAHDTRQGTDPSQFEDSTIPAGYGVGRSL